MKAEIHTPDVSTKLEFIVSDKTTAEIGATLIETGKVLLALANGTKVIHVGYDSVLLKNWWATLHYSEFTDDDIEECFESPIFLDIMRDVNDKCYTINIHPDFKEFVQTGRPLKEYAIEQLEKMRAVWKRKARS